MTGAAASIVGDTVRVGEVEIDIGAGELRRGGASIAVEPQVFVLIAYLASRPDALISRDELIEAVWGGRIVSDSAIASRVNAARAALGDDGKAQRVIKTVPRRGFRFVAAVSGAAPPPDLPDKPSVAVLPFENVSGDPEQEYFSDGIAEDIITELSRYDEMFVIARNSSFLYKGRPADAREIGRDLGVQYVLEGSVRRAGGRVRVSAQLVDAPTGKHVWAERYDRGLQDIFAVQDEITSVIVNTLVGEVVKSHVRRAMRVRPEAVNAHDHLLRAMVLFHRIEQADTRAAQREAERAIAADPSFARAHAVRSWTLSFEGALRWREDQQKTFEAAREAALKAVALDDHEPWGHAALGYSEIWGFKAYARGLVELERAIELNPNSAQFRSWYGVALCLHGRAEQGLEEVQLAMRQNPHYPPVYLNHLGRALFTLKRLDEALTVLRRGAQAQPGNASVILLTAACLIHLGRKDEAREMVGKALAASPGYRISSVRYSSPNSREEDMAYYLDALREAGLPE